MSLPAPLLPTTPHGLSNQEPGSPFLLTVTSQQVTYLYSTNLPQSSMYTQRNQKGWFLREERTATREGCDSGDANLP